MQKKPKYILDVVPLTRISSKKDPFFYYASDEKTPVGSLVEIMFLKRSLKGIVVRSREDFPRTVGIEIKIISRVIHEKTLDRSQMELARFISDYYYCPLGTVLKSFVPPISKRKKKFPKENHIASENIVTLLPEQKKAAENINLLIGESRHSSRLLTGTPGSGKTETILQAINQTKKKVSGSQFLILLPEIIQVSHYRKRLAEFFSDSEIAVISSGIKKNELENSWGKIRSGRARIILATRMGIFAPFRKLSMIAVEEEADPSFKQWDMSPRYDARLAAEELAKIHRCPLINISSAPQIATFWKFREKKNSIISISGTVSEAKNKVKNIRWEIVDLRKSFWSARRGRKMNGNISKTLANSITNCLRDSEQAILAVSRQGMSSFAVCTKCKNVLRCPDCSRAMVYDDKGEYRCLHCAQKTGIFPRCSTCGGNAFNNFGVGTQKVARELNTLFPQAKIARIDSQVARTSNALDKIIDDFNHKRIDILVGTPMITAGWNLPTITLVGIIDADNWLSLPDFATNERFYQQITRLSGRLAEGKAGKMIIQTFQPEMRIFSTFNSGYEDFYSHELSERKSLKLPPFSSLIKIIFQNHDPEKAKKSAEIVHRKISLLNNCGDFEIYGPQAPLIDRVRKRYRFQIILKSKGDWPEQLKESLREISDSAIIDVDPISLI